MQNNQSKLFGRANRRNFLKGVCTGTAGILGSSVLSRALGSNRLVGLPGHLPQETDQLDAWLSDVRKHIAQTPTDAHQKTYHESVRQLAGLVQRDAIVRMYVTQMIEQVPENNKTIHDISELLAALDHIVQTPPAFNADPKKRNTFPVSSLFVYMMFTPAGIAAFRNKEFNNALRQILKSWSKFLDSGQSRSVLNTGEDGWLSPPAYELNRLDEFVIPDRTAPHWGFKSFNDYFHRHVRPELRPISSPEDPKVIVSANDGTVYQIERNAKMRDQFWLKSQPYSLDDILDNHHLGEKFNGGDVFQSFLSGADYHRWHAPIDGTVIDTKIIDGLMFSELAVVGPDQTAGTYSQGYQASVNTRGLVFIASEDANIGIVCVVPIGITEISSVTISARIGQKIKKGEELGYFSYGGSSMCLVFQPGAINKFTAEAPQAGGDPDHGPRIKVNNQIAIAN